MSSVGALGFASCVSQFVWISCEQECLGEGRARMLLFSLEVAGLRGIKEDEGSMYRKEWLLEDMNEMLKITPS